MSEQILPYQASLDFDVELENYTGPFDALLSLIAKRQLDVTEVALAQVTEDFVAYVRELRGQDDTESVSAFVDVASLLVEAKSQALLPRDESFDSDSDFDALLERDLLFARLVQYHAYRQAASQLRELLIQESKFVPHPEPAFAVKRSRAAQTQPAELAADALGLRALAASFLGNVHAAATAPTEQLHVPLVDIEAQTKRVMEYLTSLPAGQIVTFDALLDKRTTLHRVACFIAVLVLYKNNEVRVRQESAFAPLYIRLRQQSVA